MEELADAIEDAQYVNAISTQDNGPRPVLPWEKPTPEQFAVWEDAVSKKQLAYITALKAKYLPKQGSEKDHDTHRSSTKAISIPHKDGGVYEAFTLEWVCAQPIGFFLFSQYVKETHKDYIRMNFCEETVRFRRTRGRRNRMERALLIGQSYLINPVGCDDDNADDVEARTEKKLPAKTEIVELDLCRKTTSIDLSTPEEINVMCDTNSDHPNCSESIIGLKGPIRKAIVDRFFDLLAAFPEATKIGTVNESATKKILSEGNFRDVFSQFENVSDSDNRQEQSIGTKSPPLKTTSSLIDESDDPTNSPVTMDCETPIEKDGQMDPEQSVVPQLPAQPTRSRAQSAAELTSTSTNPNYTDSEIESTVNSLTNFIMSKKFTSAMIHSSNDTTIDLSSIISSDMFDKAELVILESLKNDYWDSFQQSSHYTKLKNFLWFKDRKVLPDDFLTMRVLGRGGFGLVYACKKGTTGKLYAMKIMSKSRIKVKKSEQLCINERKALEAVNSKFVVNLNYAFHSKEEVHLVLDLMTGGDLGFHLHQRSRFSKAECLYYAARIMLGLQALHDERYVYRDLKPENCLLDEEGRVKITDLGLATKITSNLVGAAGTRGYWAPEMLRRDPNGKRIPYGHAVDWFSFGCCVAEFISGTNPFRSEAALNFGMERGKQTKEKAIDYATMEMSPEFSVHAYDSDAADLCRRLLDKNDKTRLGVNGCQEIMAHPWFKSVNWDKIITDRETPPFIPLRDINAASREEISSFPEDKALNDAVLTEKDEDIYKHWEWTNPSAFAAEVIEVLIYERETGQPLVPISEQGTCCCTIQ